MEHRLAHAGHNEHDRGGRNAVEEEQGEEAAPHTERRQDQHRPPANPIGNAADQRRCDQFAAGIAAEQQPDRADGNVRFAACPERKERHQRAVGKACAEEQEEAEQRRARQSEPGG